MGIPSSSNSASAEPEKAPDPYVTARKTIGKKTTLDASKLSDNDVDLIMLAMEELGSWSAATERYVLAKESTPLVSRPDAGSSLSDLRAINGQSFPDVLMQTMLNFQSGGGEIRRWDNAKRLSGHRGEAGETVEFKVWVQDVELYVHYHPLAEMPTGAQSGESVMHVKGSRSAPTHAFISEIQAADLGAPSLEEIRTKSVTIVDD